MPAYNVSRGWDALDDGWMSGGACRDVADSSIFFADDGRTLADKLGVIEAKRVCTQQCELRAECLTFAMEAKIEDGIWGGTTGEERRAMRRRQRQASVAV